MITPLTIYLISMLDPLKEMFIILFGISSITITVAVIILIVTYFEPSDYIILCRKKIIKTIKISFGIFITMIILNIITPTSKTMAAIYIIPAIVNNQQVQNLPTNILKFVNNYLEISENK
jgi:ABC-type multidrug transport system permease subunit